MGFRTIRIFSAMGIACMLFLYLDAKAQYSIEQLQSFLKKPITDSTRVEILNELSWEYLVISPEEAFNYAEQAEKISKNIGFVQGEATSYNRKAVALELFGRYSEAISFYEKAFDLRFSMADTIGAANVLLNIGAAYFTQGYFEPALKYYLQCVRLKEISSQKSDNTMAKAYNNIGLVYRAKRENREAVSWYKRSLRIKQKINDVVGVSNTMINISLAFQNLNLPDSALLYTDSAFAIVKENGLEKQIAGILVNKAAFLKDQKKYEASEALLADAFEWLKIYPDEQVMIYALKQQAENWTREEKYSRAVENLKQAIEISSRLNLREILQASYEELAAVYEQSGDLKKALQTYRLSSQLKDSLFNSESERSLNELQTIYATSKKEESIARLNDENKNKDLLIRQSRERNFFLFIITFITFLALLALLYSLRTNKKYNKRLEAQNEIIEDALAEKELLLKEIHHRVKNNLQVISGLLYLQSKNISDEKIADVVNEGRNRVKSMALIHQKMYQQDNLTGVNMTEYINELAGNVVSSHQTGVQNIELIVDSDPLFLDVDTAIPLGLIINELLTNATKYAFKLAEVEKPKISIRLKLLDNLLKLSVSDNGSGISDAEAVFKTNNSFGLKLIDSLAKKLRAELGIQTNNGTMVTLDIYKFKLSKNG